VGKRAHERVLEQKSGGVMMKRIACVLVVGIFLLPLGFIGQGAAAPAGPIKIGFMGSYQGIFTKNGTDMRDGFKLYLDEVKSKVAGREIVLFNEDDEGKPELGPIKAKKLVEKDGAQIIAGIVPSGVAYAVRDYLVERKIPVVIGIAGATRLTQELRSPYIFRVCYASGQQDLAGGWYGYAKLGMRKTIIMAPDYAGGHEKADAFMKTFKFMGGEVVQQIYAPLGTTDLAPYLAQLANYVGKVDRIWAFFTGSDAITFINQYAEYGMKEKIKLWTPGETVDDTFLPSQKEAALGVESYQHYAYALDTPENKRFVDIFRKKYNFDPGQFAEQGYVAAQVIVKALEAVKGKIEDQAAFLKAMKSVKYEAPRGPFRFDDYQNVVENIYCRRVVKKEGKYVNAVFDKVPDVDQFWMPKK
jgi:branched-chain amino acid transport system substrate-binding protein